MDLNQHTYTFDLSQTAQYTPWISTQRLEEIAIHLHTPSTTAAGTFTIEGSCDGANVRKDQDSGTDPSATAAAKVTLSTNSYRVEGTALALSLTAAAGETIVTFVAGAVPAYVRVVYTKTSGSGSTSVFVSARYR